MAVRELVSHVYPIGSRLTESGRLEVGGCDVVELAREFGTPAYVVAEDDVRTRARAYRDALSARQEDSDVLFASKAFPCTAVMRLFEEEGLAVDVASGGELALALRAGFPGDRIYLHGNAKGEDEMRAALDAGVGHVVLDSAHDLERLEALVAERSARQRVLLRVTPGVRPDTHAAISTGHTDSKFGFALDAARDAVERLAGSERLELVGLHFHLGSQLFDLDVVRAALEAIAPMGDFPVYDVGGGLGVAYTAEDDPPSIEEHVETAVAAVHEVMGPGKRILLEPGRALVANAGITLYRVQTVKPGALTQVAVDGGMSDNLRPMLYGARYEAQIADRFGGSEACRVVGKHCESGDVIVPHAELDDPRPGDLLVTPATGAYGHAMANNYNGVPRPPVVFCSGGRARLVVRRETYDDLTARDVP